MNRKTPYILLVSIIFLTGCLKTSLYDYIYSSETDCYTEEAEDYDDENTTTVYYFYCFFVDYNFEFQFEGNKFSIITSLQGISASNSKMLLKHDKTSIFFDVKNDFQIINDFSGVFNYNNNDYTVKNGVGYRDENGLIFIKISLEKDNQQYTLFINGT